MNGVGIPLETPLSSRLGLSLFSLTNIEPALVKRGWREYSYFGRFHLTLLGLRGGGNIATLTFERLSSKNYLSQ